MSIFSADRYKRCALECLRVDEYVDVNVYKYIGMLVLCISVSKRRLNKTCIAHKIC